ncbi:MAG: tRNA (cytidine(56)-2'-O)-methyltransferase [Candidatus Diapherotrites archaeon]
MTKDIVILRYGHRVVRDYRVTSHCCLVARALGASKIIIQGDEDESIQNSVNDIVKRWGGDFKVEIAESWKGVIETYKAKKYLIVHATMYGSHIQKIESKLRKSDKILLIIGSQKVESEVYDLSDYNVSVTNQPHSEIAALAVILDRLFEGKELDKKFRNAKIKITPQAKGKKVAKKTN